MQNYRIFLVAAAAVTTICYADSPFQQKQFDPVYSHQTFMFTRPAYQQASIQEGLWHSIIYEKKGTWRGAFRITGIVQTSKEFTDEVRQYFLLPCKTDLLIAGDEVSSYFYCRDVRAEWLNLPSNFSGYMTATPRQKQFGCVLEFHQDLCNIIDVNFLKESWLRAAVPIMSVENELRVHTWGEHNVGTDFPATIKEALCQSTWKFAKMGCKHSVTEPSEFNVRIGKSYLAHDFYQLTYFTGLSIPVAGRQKPEHLFYPFAGYNGHMGVEAGLHVQVPLTRELTPYAFSFFFGLDTIFLVRDKQCRTFDLVDKPWSRYMLYNLKHGTPDQKIPGVNLLTQYVRVFPYNLSDFSCGWRLRTDHLEIELGYNVWGHGNEKIQPIHYVHKEFGIAGTKPLIDPITKNPEASTASHSTIDLLAEDDDSFVCVCESDIDWKSGASRTAINHKAHITVGALQNGERYDGLFGLGIYFEFPQKHTALFSWGMWATVGATF
jgi:hypothetical protein